MRQRLRTKQPTNDMRKKIERHILAYHKDFTQMIKYMTCEVLLAYAHPYDRPKFARQLFEEGLLREEIARRYYVYD